MESLLRQFLSQDTETEILEFKEAKNQYDKDKLGRYFSALSNEANLKNRPNAWLILGVDNNKQIVGTQISDTQINEYKKEISDHTAPNLSFREVHKVQIEGKLVLLCEIPAAPKGIPVAWKKQFYGRDGESLGTLNIDELDRFREQSNAFDWSSQIIEHANLDDLSPEAIAIARQKYSEKNPHLKEEMNTWDDITFLNKAKITIQGKVTHTAILLLGKPDSEHFISPSTAKISWILKDKDGLEKDYQHFTCPLLLSVQSVYSKIRNLNYRYLQDGSIFPEEVSQFDPYIIREALHNCVAHQDYTLGGKINVIEREDGILIFSNSGDFIPGTVEKVVESDSPETKYRNPFLANAMVDLKMIDTIGSGIRRMFVIQKNKYFPLPDYDFSDRKVTVKITGKVVDLNYARKLAQMPGLSLNEIMLLDKVSKGKLLEEHEIQQLKRKKLIEGRKPNFHISAIVAKKSNQKADYIKLKGIDDQYSMALIKEYLDKFKVASRSDIEEFLLDKLGDRFSDEQKKHKVKNMLQKMKSMEEIRVNQERKWELVPEGEKTGGI
ncbi:RNA-binding domain-containing protein [Lunatimonas salinarum]|uniref:RNA-binding domain-containing protein n=1 Tax=Lunatimonas salinarum TaxID=1774590 RepID=UPI001AE06612|nr:RNA-binding domain-containing protein [Lunatimonas salinarum]